MGCPGSRGGKPRKPDFRMSSSSAGPTGRNRVKGGMALSYCSTQEVKPRRSGAGSRRPRVEGTSLTPKRHLGGVPDCSETSRGGAPVPRGRGGPCSRPWAATSSATTCVTTVPSTGPSASCSVWSPSSRWPRSSPSTRPSSTRSSPSALATIDRPTAAHRRRPPVARASGHSEPPETRAGGLGALHRRCPRRWCCAPAQRRALRFGRRNPRSALADPGAKRVLRGRRGRRGAPCA